MLTFVKDLLLKNSNEIKYVYLEIIVIIICFCLWKIIKECKNINNRENKGISGNSNEALKMVTGDFIALLDHDDLLPIFSLYEIVKCINENPNVEFIYTDEDKFEKLGVRRYEPYFKSDFAPDTLRANNFICHFSVFKKELMDKLGEFRSEFNV